MKKIIFLLPIFLLAGLNDSYAFKKGFEEGKIIKMSLFNRFLSKEVINKKCLEAYEKDSKDNKYIKENKNVFLKGCIEALSGF